MPNNTGLRPNWGFSEWEFDPIKAAKAAKRAALKKARMERDAMLSETSKLLAALAVQMNASPTKKAAKERLRDQERRIVRMVRAYAHGGPIHRVECDIHTGTTVASQYGMRAVAVGSYCYLYRSAKLAGIVHRPVDTLPDVIAPSVPDVDIWSLAALNILSREYLPA